MVLVDGMYYNETQKYKRNGATDLGGEMEQLSLAASGVAGQRPASSVGSAASTTARQRALSAADYVRRHAMPDGKVAVPTFSQLLQAAAGPRPVTTNSMRSGNQRCGTPDVTSRDIGKHAWAPSAQRPRSQQAGREAVHHLSVSSGWGRAIKEADDAGDNTCTRYRQEYPEKHVKKEKPKLSRSFRDPEFEMGTRDLIGDVDQSPETEDPHPTAKVVKHRPLLPRGGREDYRGRMTKVTHSFAEGHPEREVFQTISRDAGQQANSKVWQDFKKGKLRVGRSNAKAAEAARKTQMNFMNPAMNKEGVDRMIMESLQEADYREPKGELLSALTAESRAIKAEWKIKNGPDTFLVHRHPGAPGGPVDAPIPGIEYPGKWGEQVDDSYRFKRRPGGHIYFQGADDVDGGGVPEVMGMERWMKPHALPSHNAATFQKPKDMYGNSPRKTSLPCGSKVTASSWTPGDGTESAFYKKNEAHDGVWLRSTQVGSGVKRHPKNKTASQVAFDDLTAESEQTNRAKPGYRPHFKKTSLQIQQPVEVRWTRQSSYMHQHRKGRSPFAVSGESQQQVSEEMDRAGGKVSTELPAKASAANTKMLAAAVVGNSRPRLGTTHKTAFVDHTLEAYKRNFSTALAMDTRGLSKKDFGMSLRA